MSAVIIVVLCGVLIAISRERKAWNRGVSPEGEPWRRFDTDSQGGRGYTDFSGNYCWISWPIDRSKP